MMNTKRPEISISVLGLIQLAGALMAAGSGMAWTLTNPFQYIGDPLVLLFETPEMILLVGFVTYLFSTGFLVAVLEAVLKTRGLDNRPALMGFFPIKGDVPCLLPFFSQRVTGDDPAFFRDYYCSNDGWADHPG